MTTSLSSSIQPANNAQAYGPISQDMYAALLDLSSFVHLLPADVALDARKRLHSLFDCQTRVAGLENTAFVTAGLLSVPQPATVLNS